MAYEFKKLGDVEVVETPMDTANVLIEEDGVIKKVAKGEVGGVKVASTAEVGQTIVVKAVDENGNPTEWECADVVKSWDKLADKPFYEKEAEPLFEGEVELSNIEFDLYPLFTLEEGNYYKVVVDGIEYSVQCGFDDTDSSPAMWIELNDGGIAIFSKYGDRCWVKGWNDATGTHTLKIINPAETVIKQIDPKFIPQSGGDSIIFDLLVEDDASGYPRAVDPNVNLYHEVFKEGKLPVMRYANHHSRYYYSDFDSSDGDCYVFTTLNGNFTKRFYG